MSRSENHWYPGTSLREWRLHNFKSVPDATVALTPLTVVIGENSAGKSTLLQSIRAVSQAVLARGATFPLNGDQVRLGTYDETLHADAPDDDREIGIGGTFYFGSRPGRFAIGSRLAETAENRRLRRVAGDLHDGTLRWDVRLGGSPDRQPGQTILRSSSATACWAEVPDAAISSKASGAGNAVERSYPGTLSDGQESHRLASVGHSGGFARTAIVETDLVDSLVAAWTQCASGLIVDAMLQSRREGTGDLPMGPSEVPLAAVAAEDIRWVIDRIGEDEACTPESERRILSLLTQRLVGNGPELSGLLSDGAVDGAEVHRLLRIRRVARRSLALPDPLALALSASRDFVSESVFHLGPLRTDPQVVYTSAPVGRTGYLGTKGEFCAAVLHTESRTPVAVPMPGGAVGETMKRVRLGDAVNAWASELGIGVAFTTTDKGRLGIELGVRQSSLDMNLDLTSVGTGVSQLLPVLVMCLLAPVGSLLLIEQPELHLNPAVQQRLGDFLLAIAGSGRQLVVETHSDYLVGRLRRRVAEDPARVHDLVSLLFAERVDGRSSYESVTPAQDGTLARWPKGFFDLAAEDAEAMLRAGLEGHQ